MRKDPISIIIPWVPPSNSLPNRTTSRWAIASIRSQIREQVKLEVVSVLNTNLWVYEHTPFEGETACRVTIYWGRELTKGKKATGMVRWRQKADADNLMAAMKGAYDALEDASVIVNDRDLVHYPLKQERDPAGKGYTMFELWSVG